MKRCILILSTLLLAFACNRAADSNKLAGTTPHNEKAMMAVFAHSDDELIVSPILSKYAKSGVNIYLVIATDGSKGLSVRQGFVYTNQFKNDKSNQLFSLGIINPVFYRIYRWL